MIKEKPRVRAAGQILLVPAEKLRVNPLRARIYYNEESMARLTRSVAAFGILEPLCVVAASDGNYVLVSGERRFRAARRLGFETLPCVLLPGGGEESLYASLSNAVCGAPLSFFEVALAVERLHDRFGVPYEEIARRLGLEPGEVYSRLRLLRIPPPLRLVMVENGLSEAYARIFLPLEEADMTRLLDEVGKERLTLCEAKARARALLSPDELRSTVFPNGDGPTRALRSPDEGEKGRVVTFYKDSSAFRNTIETAVERCRTVGLPAQMDREERGDEVEYRIRMKK